MAIQISEKHLSPEAKRALQNAKSKSQFLRDAIEYYVSREVPGKNNTDLELKADIKEIKELLLKITSQQTIAESAISKESLSTYQDEEVMKEKIIPIDTKKEIEEKLIQKSTQVDVNKTNVEIKEPIKKQELEKVEEPVTSNVSDDGLSEEEKNEIEKMLDYSLEFFS